MGGWTEGTKSVLDKAVSPPLFTPPRNAGRGSGFAEISSLLGPFEATALASAFVRWLLFWLLPHKKPRRCAIFPGLDLAPL